MFGKQAKILFFLLLLSTVFFVKTGLLHAAVKDTDLDGLTDEAETKVYQTDPLNPDTDGDSIFDGQEIIDDTNPLDPLDSLPLRYEATRNASILHSESLAWYVGRASGIFAFMLLSLVVINGLLISTRLVAHFMPPALNYEMHRYFAWMALLTTVGHIAAFTWDPFTHLRWVEAFTPFLLDRPMISTLGYHLRIPVTMGIFALYGILTLLLTSEFRSKLSLKTWRRTHYISFLTYLLFLGHGIFSGTDTKEWWMIWVYSFSASFVTLLILVRIWKSLTKKKAPLPSVPPDPFSGLTRLPSPPPARKIL
ncbi:MAG: ferric reductase-like transmembrane domain-containing protein [Candidatus Moraniibacteriota bacterium]